MEGETWLLLWWWCDGGGVMEVKLRIKKETKRTRGAIKMMIHREEN